MNDIDTIKQLLPKLNKLQLDEVILQCKSLKQFSNSKTSSESGGVDDLVLHAISEVVKNMGGDVVDHFIMKRIPEYASFKRKCGPLMDYLKPVGSRNEQFAALCLGIELLYRQLTIQRMPATARRLLREIHRVPETINQSFPGYAMCGLLHLIIKEKVKC